MPSPSPQTVGHRLIFKSSGINHSAQIYRVFDGLMVSKGLPRGDGGVLFNSLIVSSEWLFSIAWATRRYIFKFGEYTTRPARPTGELKPENRQRAHPSQYS